MYGGPNKSEKPSDNTSESPSSSFVSRKGGSQAEQLGLFLGENKHCCIGLRLQSKLEMAFQFHELSSVFLGSYLRSNDPARALGSRRKGEREGGGGEGERGALRSGMSGRRETALPAGMPR